MTNKTETRDNGELAKLYIEINSRIHWSKISKSAIHALIETIKGLERSKEAEEEAQAKEARRKQWNHLQEEFGQCERLDTELAERLLASNKCPIDHDHTMREIANDKAVAERDTEFFASVAGKYNIVGNGFPNYGAYYGMDCICRGTWKEVNSAIDKMKNENARKDAEIPVRGDSVRNVKFIPSYTTDPRLTLHDDNVKTEPKYKTQELAAIGCSRWRVFYGGKPFEMTYASPGEAAEFIRKQKALAAEPLPLNSSTEIS